MVSDHEQVPTMPMADGDGDDAAAGATYGRFVSLGVIGRGGMGVVLRARDPELDRDVAIKLLGAGSWQADPTSTARLQREAQAMAKLSHPNVVHVYEMGQVGPARFIAMELVEGTTLRRWLAQPRPWPEVLAAFVACGRGLAAAHAAGLVHRDFKPENVLIGPDGRPRVSDFGLVAYGTAIAEGDAGDASPVTVLTVRGSTMGTPAYMAAEQWKGEEVDARTDQFAFCVALWEALYGERPFAGGVSGELREHIVAGDIRPPPTAARVPRRIELALRRGLALDRAARWPSMTALLAELDRPRSRRLPWIAAAAVVVAAAATAIVIATRPGDDPCPDPRARLAGVWDRAVHDKVAAAFATASPAVARETMDRITPALDGYSADWRAAMRAACRATRVDGTQSAALMDQRVLCLERRRTELAGLTTAFAGADRALVAAAVDHVGGLGELEGCADQEKLLASAAPIAPEQRAQVDALEAELAASGAMEYDNRPPERLARAQAALATARTLDRLPQRVHALEEVSAAADGAGDDVAREAALRELAQAATEAHDDRLAAHAWIELIRMLAKQHRFDEAKGFESVAQATVARAGSPAKLKFELTFALGDRALFTNDLPAALDLMQKSVELATSDLERATARLALSQVMFQKEGPKQAMPLTEQAVAALEAAYGPDHPRTADGLYQIAQFLTAADDLDRAEQVATRALKIREAAFGADSEEVGMMLHILGNIANSRDDVATARGYYERAIANFDARHQVGRAGLSRGMLASIVTDQDGLAAGRPIFEQALADLNEAGRGKPQYVSTELNFANRLAEAGDCTAAAPLLAHATEALANSPQRQPYALVPGAKCDVLAKRPADAIKKLEIAHTNCAGGECSPPIALEADWQLAKLLVETGKDRARGNKIVDDVLARTGEYDTDLVNEIKAWRAKRPR